MKVTLLHATPLDQTAYAARTCWMSHERSDNGGPKDCEFIDRVGNKFKHASILEHQIYKFEVVGVSRALLQEQSRHRMASYSVKSTRYTLKELKDEESFLGSISDMERAKNYLVMTNNRKINLASVKALENVRELLQTNTSNDEIKYCLPESYKTQYVMTINARSLQNFLSLRSDKAALWEIRDLARSLFNVLPEDHKFLFEECMKDNI